MNHSEPESAALDRAVFRLLITSFESELPSDVLLRELDLVYELLERSSLPSSIELLDSVGIYHRDENVATRALHVLRRAKSLRAPSTAPAPADRGLDEESIRRLYTLEEEEAPEKAEPSEPEQAPAFEDELDESVFEQEPSDTEVPVEPPLMDEEMGGSVEQTPSEQVESEQSVWEAEEAVSEQEEAPEEAEPSEPEQAPAFEDELDESVFEESMEVPAELEPSPDEEPENPFGETTPEEPEEGEDKDSSSDVVDIDSAAEKLKELKSKYLDR
ncbi:MAG: hypothetical protein ACXQS1_04525 [Methermicoccaceae archaeon]